MSAKFSNVDLKLIIPDFNSSVTDLIIELDYLRKMKLTGTTHPLIFFQLKSVFQTLESIGSARIEGNNTTIADFIENKLSNKKSKKQDILEIINIERSMKFIDENIDDIRINRMFISELHKHIVEGLVPPPTGEGDKTPGIYREYNIEITKSKHSPPAPFQIESFMNELFKFIISDHTSKYDLIKMAMTHHRFVWIHPFGNGNGRTVRLLTYAMLVKQGFNVKQNRIINPSAIFINDRDLYYKYLSKADTGNKSGILEWIEYVLSGLKTEIEKIDKLLDYSYLKKNILYKSIRYSKESSQISENEFKILKIAIDKQIFQANDLKSIFPNKISAEISRNIKRLKDKDIIIPEKENGRKYIVNYQCKTLLYGVIRALDINGFLPIKNN